MAKYTQRFGQGSDD